jgi:glycosyltransferase involved in cell wall biosynthesis
MLTTFYPPYNFGGDGIGIQRLAHAFARRGHDVTIVHDADAYNALHNGPEPADTPEPERVNVIRLRSPFGTLSPLLTQQLGRPLANGNRIRKLLKDGRFDVTIFNNVSLIGGPGILDSGQGVVLYEAHEHWLVCPSHVLWRHNREPCTDRQCLRCVLHFRRPPQVWRYTGLLERQSRHVDAFIAKSEFSRRKHHEFGFKRDMTVIPYFLPDVQDPDTSPGKGEVFAAHPRPYFLFVGRLERIKGLDDVIPAMRRYPDADLLIAGDGEHADVLKQLAAGAPNVHFLGRIPLDRLRALYRRAIALIVPSAGFETFGIILIEAFREGVPVIARSIGPFPEIVNACDGGLLFATTDELLSAMNRMQSDGALRSLLGSNGRHGYERLWTEEAVVPRYMDLIHGLAERKGMPVAIRSQRKEGVA